MNGHKAAKKYNAWAKEKHEQRNGAKTRFNSAAHLLAVLLQRLNF